MFTAEVTQNAEFGTFTETYESPVEFTLQEWEEGVVVHSEGHVFIYVSTANLASVILRNDTDDDDDETAEVGL